MQSVLKKKSELTHSFVCKMLVKYESKSLKVRFHREPTWGPQLAFLLLLAYSCCLLCAGSSAPDQKADQVSHLATK